MANENGIKRVSRSVGTLALLGLVVVAHASCSGSAADGGDDSNSSTAGTPSGVVGATGAGGASAASSGSTSGGATSATGAGGSATATGSDAMAGVGGSAVASGMGGSGGDPTTSGAGASGGTGGSTSGGEGGSAGTPAPVDEFWVAPTGLDNNPGTEAMPFKTIQKALDVALAGRTIWVKGGSYPSVVKLTLERSGTQEQPIRLWAVEGERPVLDFTSQARNTNNRGIQLEGDYWHIRGLEIQNAADNG
ncbi:MAG TPA: DUF1565 domain-containing protein, partial [Polyangiaceae bacterium]